MENNKNNIQLLKIGEDIIFGKTGIDYKFEPGKVYVPKVDNFSDEVKLNVGNSLSLPEKLYSPKSDTKFIDKVLKAYNASDKTTGVLLAGVKGTGKTVMAKKLAVDSNLPILTIDNSIHPRFLKQLFAKIENTPMCVIFDEFDKLGERYDSDYILQVFDGVSSSGKHLLVLTCNETEDVNQYMLDRCSRVRYYREFDEMSSSMIKEILEDRLDDKSNIDELVDFVLENFGLVSFDNVASFADEINLFPDETAEDLFNDMNISSN